MAVRIQSLVAIQQQAAKKRSVASGAKPQLKEQELKTRRPVSVAPSK